MIDSTCNKKLLAVLYSCRIRLNIKSKKEKYHWSRPAQYHYLRKLQERIIEEINSSLFFHCRTGGVVRIHLPD